MKNLKINFTPLVLLSFFISFNSLYAQDWPTYQNDANRSCISTSELNSNLHLQWKYQATMPPKPAWADPAKTDYWHREANLKPRVVYDKAYHVISVADKVYYGSSANDKIYCLDTNTGKEIWSYFTGGPVRLVPSYSNGKIYAGSDDGVMYCLNAKNGKLLWKIDTAPGERFLPGNERVISTSAIRTGVLVDDGVAYFCSGMFPNEGVDFYAVNAENGNIIWKKADLGISPQGYLLATKKNIYIPTGRTAPKIFSRKDGKQIGNYDGNGGTYALLVDDGLIYGGGDEGELDYESKNGYKDEKDQIASFLGLQIVVKGGTSFLRSDNELSAIKREKYIEGYKDWSKVKDKKSDLSEDLWDLREQRKFASKEEIKNIDAKIIKLITKISQFDEKRETIEKGGLVWKEKIDPSYSMILSGNSIVLGTKGKVEMFDSNTGKKQWTQSVDGIVYSLAVANGNLLVSTDKGLIYSFSDKSNSNPKTISPNIVANPYKNNSNNDLYAKALDKILKQGIEKGYCLVIGSETGRLAYEIATKTNLKVIGIEDDFSRVLKSRELLDKAGIYGEKVTIIHGSLSKLPLNKYFANLIISDELLLTGELTTSSDEVFRVLKPFGGIAILGVEKGKNKFFNQWVRNAKEDWNSDKNWASITRGKIKGAGEWTHLYADAGNSASSNDSVQGPFQVQWFGRPGPVDMINRHSRPMSPLFKDGRLFIPGDNRIICVDAYNGTPLWKRYVPDSRILGALRDCGTMAVTDDRIYIAAGQTALGFKVENGEQDITLEAPQLVQGQESKWGYLSVVGDQIFGSGKKSEASFMVLGRINCDQFEGDNRDMVSSDYLFSLNRKTGETLWTYKGLVFNNTITIGDNSIYFVESRNAKALKDFDGRLQVDEFCEGPTYIVKLNKTTGEKEWEKEFEFPYSEIMFLSYSKNTLLITGSFNIGLNVHYKMFAFNGKTGNKIWENQYQGGKKDGSHGEQWQHPVIMGDKIFLLPYIFNLADGKQGDLYLSRGGCGTFSASANNLFARNSNPSFYDITGKQSGDAITKVSRPGCWINIIPAGDLISIPEASSGCTCDYPIQTSFVFISKN